MPSYPELTEALEHKSNSVYVKQEERKQEEERKEAIRRQAGAAITQMMAYYLKSGNIIAVTAHMKGVVSLFYSHLQRLH